jgi:hypothetical protein
MVFSSWIQWSNSASFNSHFNPRLKMANIIKVNAAEAAKCIATCWHAKLVPMLHGEPAIGKSQIIWALANLYNLVVIDIRLSQSDPVDLSGCITIHDGRGTYAPMDHFPLEDAKLPKGKNGWAIFFDEINSCPAAVQAASYKPVLDRMIGQRHFHDKVFIAAAGNLITDMALVNKMGTAMQSRLIHFRLGVDHEPWARWAGGAGIYQRIIGYINANPSMLHKFDPMHQEHTFPSPRTWEFASRIIAKNKHPELEMPMLAGTVGEGAANGYITYSEVYADMPTIGDIEQSPEGIALPTDPAALAAVSTMVGSHMNKKNVDKLLKWVHRLGIEYQVFCMRDAMARTPVLITHKGVDDWATRNAKVLA